MAAGRLGFLPQSPLYCFILLIQYTVPPAMSIGTKIFFLFCFGNITCFIHRSFSLILLMATPCYLMMRVKRNWLQVQWHNCLMHVKKSALWSSYGLTWLLPSRSQFGQWSSCGSYYRIMFWGTINIRRICSSSFYDTSRKRRYNSYPTSRDHKATESRREFLLNISIYFFLSLTMLWHGFHTNWIISSVFSFLHHISFSSQTFWYR